VQAEVVHRSGEVEVEDAGLDPREPLLDVDLEDPVEPRRHDDERVTHRGGTAREPRSAPPGDERAVVARRDRHCRRELLAGLGEAHRDRVTPFGARVALVQRELERFGPGAIRPERSAQIGQQCVVRCDPTSLRRATAAPVPGAARLRGERSIGSRASVA
jgi:hypothetical protein